MSSTRSARFRGIDAMADLPGSAVTGAFHIARHAGGRSAGAGVGLFALAGARAALFLLLVGDDLLRRAFG